MGSIFLLIVVAILTLCSLLNKYTVSKISPFTIQWIQAGLNALTLPLWYYLSKRFAPQETIPSNVWATALIAGVLSSLGFVLFLAALKDKPVFIATAYLSTYPAITMVICAMMGSEKLSIARIAGVAAILCGVLLIQVFDKI